MTTIRLVEVIDKLAFLNLNFSLPSTAEFGSSIQIISGNAIIGLTVIVGAPGMNDNIGSLLRFNVKLGKSTFDI